MRSSQRKKGEEGFVIDIKRFDVERKILKINRSANFE